MKVLRLIIVLITIMGCMQLKAQKWSCGVKLGMDLSVMKMVDIPQTISHPLMYTPIGSYNMNAYISYKCNNWLGVSVEPGYIRMGGIQNFDYMTSNFRPIKNYTNVELHYLQVPMLLDFYLNKQISISTGLEWDYRFAEKSIVSNVPTNSYQGLYIARTERSTQIWSGFRDNILPDSNQRKSSCFLIGANYQINDRFGIGLRYGLGLYNIMDVVWIDESGYTAESSFVKTDYLQFSLKMKIL